MWLWIFLYVFFTVSLLILARLNDTSWDAAFVMPIILITTVTGVILFYPIVKISSGLDPNYSSGFTEGYVFDIEYEGLFYKTWEGYIQAATDDGHVYDAVASFSCDSARADTLKGLIGKKVRLYYDEWFIQPAKFGNTSFQITKIEPL